MRICHIKNVAGYASRLAQAQRALGHEAIVLAHEHPFGFPYDVLMPSGLKWNLWMLKRWKWLREFDVLHIHGGIWPGQVFYPLFKDLTGMRTIVHFHGGETRTGKGLHWLRVADNVFYTPPDLQAWHPKGTWMPQPIDVPPEPAEWFEHERPMFVHFTTNEQNKGTTRVIDMFFTAFGPLQHSYLDFPTGGRKDFYIGKDVELWVLRGIPYDHVESVIRRADVVFDQIAPYGIYGYVAVEAMALGKPVLSPINRELYPTACPVIYPHVTKLMELAHDESGRRHYGALGRAYVERVHAAPVVAQKALDIANL